MRIKTFRHKIVTTKFFVQIVRRQIRICLLVRIGPIKSFHKRGTQRIVSVNYLFGRPLIPYNFLKGIFTSNFRDMENFRPSVFGLHDKNIVSKAEKRSAKIFGKEIRP